MENNDTDTLKAFLITTKNNSYDEDQYVVIANSFSEAEKIYWEQLCGYHDITSIKLIDAKNVAYPKRDSFEQIDYSLDAVKTFKSKLNINN